MSLSGLLARFAVIYLGLLISSTILFKMLGTQMIAGVNTGALIGAVLGACLWFAAKNGRYLTASEKKVACLGMLAIDLALQVVVALSMNDEAGARMPLDLMLFAIGFAGLLHGLGIYFMVGVAGKHYAKQQSKAA